MALYVRTIRNAERWFEHHGLSLATATAVEVADYLATQSRTWSVRNLLRAALTHYWDITGHADPPLRAMRVPSKPRMVCRALDPGDARILAKAARAHGGSAGMAAVLGLYMGLRREEIAGVRWDDFSESELRVIGKGEKQADLPLHPVVLELLAEHPRRGPWLFPGEGRDHVHPATVWQWIRDLAQAAGVGLVSTHILRHTCLATANDATGDLRAVQEFARHARPETTANYTRASAQRLDAVMRSIDYEGEL
ncbi:MAG: tyrosine-type recombinase/integrase [Actinomycetota bacterium]|nr:tyrosine-type recombinase/integrase [Actinomycetota bacterium]